MNKVIGALFGLGLYFWMTAAPLWAAGPLEEEALRRPFNALWLAVFLMAIAVFLSLAHWRSSEEI